jgi:hypothetical protein
MADANKLIQNNTKLIIANEKAWSKLIEPLNKANKAIKDAVGIQKQFNDQLKNAKTSKEFATAQKQIEGNIKAVALAEKEAIRIQAEGEKLKRQRIQTEKALNKEITAQKGSINALRQANSKLRKERNNLNLSTKEGKKRLGELNREIDKNDKKINKNNDSLSRQRANIGNYSSAMSGLGGAIGGTVQGIVSMTRAAAAFIATPFGIALAAIVIAIQSIVTYFKSSEEGQNRWNKIMNAGNVILGNMSDAFSALGKALLDPMETLESISDWFQNTFGNLVMGIIERNIAGIQKQFSLIGLAWEEVKDVFTDNSEGIAAAQAKVVESNEKIDAANKKIIEGVKDVSKEYENGKRAISAFIEEQEREIAISNRLSDLEAKRDLLRRKLIVDQEKLRAKSRELRLRAEQNEGAERIRLLEEAFAIEDELGKRREEIALINLELKRENNKLSNSTKEDLDEEARLESELFIIQQQRLKLQRTLTTQINTERNKQNAARLAEERQTTKELEALDQEYLDAYFAAEDAKTKKLQEEEAKRKELINQGKELAIDTAATILANSIATNALRVDDEIAKNREELNTKLADESLNEDQRAVLQAEAKKREDALKLKKAKAEKKDALFRIGINTAAAVVKTLATLGIPAGIIPAAAAAAAGLAEAAVVSAKPLPKFDKGTKSAPTGGFWAGEKRGEFMIKDGNVSYIDKPTMFGDDYAGSTIIGGAQSAQIMDQIGRQEAVDNITGYNEAVAAQMLDLAMLKLETRNQTKAIVGAINNNKPSGLDEMRKRNYDNGINKHRS